MIAGEQPGFESDARIGSWSTNFENRRVYTLDGSEPTQASQRYIDPIPVLTAKTFPLSQTADATLAGNTVARMEFGLAKAKWKIVDCDSQDGEEGTPHNAIDDDPTTYWHTRFRDKVDPMPHHITVDLGETVTIRGFTYTPRQDLWDGGIILRAQFELSEDGKNWVTAADEVDFDNIINSRKQHIIELPKHMSARYSRLTALRTAGDKDFASAADVSVLVK